ncbi:TPA: lysis system i-spanin subunit Rz, partial [Klebsiella michiganensis]
AERDYFTLRERIATITSQLTRLQAFVRQKCSG